jgi:hypothetical protein
MTENVNCAVRMDDLEMNRPTFSSLIWTGNISEVQNYLTFSTRTRSCKEFISEGLSYLVMNDLMTQQNSLMCIIYG